MLPQIVLPLKQYGRYKRKALQTTNELLVFLVGRTHEGGQVEVVDLVYPVGGAGETWAEWNPQDVLRLQAQILPLEVLGTLHSHPNCEPHLSKEDIETAERFGEVVFGVFSYWVPDNKTRRRTSLDFYCGAKPVIVTLS